MNTFQIRLVSSGFFFLFIFLSGFWLGHSGRPLNGLILAVHKLISLAAVVFLITTVTRLQQVAPLSPLQMAAVAVTVVCFLITIVTGGLVSSGRAMPSVVMLFHRLFPYLTILSNAVALFLLPLSGRG